MSTNETQNQVSDQEALDKALKATVANLQAIGDDKRVNEVVYGWLKQFNVSIHEDASEQLCGALLGIVQRVREGKDRPTDADVRASLESNNTFAAEHNAEPRLTTKLRVLDLSLLPEVLVA
jgi:hypothetical protein